MKLSVGRVVVVLLAGPASLGYPENQPKPAEQWQVDGITAALEDPLPAVRIRALLQIASFSKLQGVPTSPIVPFLKDPDHNIRRAAVSALGAMQAKDQTGEIVKLLKDPDILVQSAAASALGAMQAKDQTGEVVKLLKDPDILVQSAAASALGAMQVKDQAGEVVKLLKDPDPRVRSEAASALGAMQAKDQAGEVVKLLKDPNYDVSRAATSALEAMQAKEQAGEFVKLLKDPDARVRRDAASALGAMQAKDQAGKVVKLLKDPDPRVRSEAASALGAMQAKDQAGEVVQLLKDPDRSVRIAAATALGAMQAKDQVGELVKLLKNPDSNVRIAAATALGAMQAKDQAGEVVKLLKDPDIFVQNAAASALGAMQIKDQAGEVIKLLKDPDARVRRDAASALGAMQAKDQAGELVKLLKDPDPNVRIATATALGAIQAKDQAGEVVKLLKDPDIYVRRSAATALGALAPFPRTILPNLSATYYFDHARQAEVRFLCYYLSGGDASVRVVLRRIMFESDKPDQNPARLLLVEQARTTLRAFHEILPARPTNSGFAVEAERQILAINREWRTKWSSADRGLISSLSQQMSDDGAAALRAIVEVPWWQTAFSKLWKIVAVQIAFWILLLYFYPTSTQVQAFFFWNRWARKFFGLGYVDLFLTWVPFLRNRLLAPFREELLADARVGDESLNEYFEDVQALEGEKPVRLGEAITEVKGQIVLEGESGLGKSMFLRRLTKNTTYPVAYLPADNCDHGVFASIQLRLKGKAGDESFLKSIIWSGGLTIVIDGLNEVTAETREKIRRFLDDFPKAHILLATQPMLWKRPPKARALRLLKLSDDRILSFLESRYASFTPPAPMSEQEYKEKCRAYVDEVLGRAQAEEDQSAARLALSNPMDLTTAAQILVSGERPTVKNLQEQQFRRMSGEFRDTHPGQEFPLMQLSESVYERRLHDDVTLDSGQFFEAIQAMVIRKMALPQFDIDADAKPTRKWVFRHDKIRDYFLVQAFGAQEGRIREHIDDPRFRGVYLMLSSQLPLEQAKELRDVLVDRAAETKDHHLSDAVVEVLKTRKPSSTPPA